MFLLFFIAFSLNILAQQPEICVNNFKEAQELLKNYNYSEAEKKLEEVQMSCPLEKNVFIYNQLAMIYIWEEKFDKAKPIIDKINKESEYQMTQNPSVQAFGKGRMLNVLYLNYKNETKELEKEIANFNDLNFKTQEAIFVYFLRKNDKRFLQYYGIRRQVKGDMVPFLCKVYCKKNSIIKDCPCVEEIDRKIEGGVYSILQAYLNGEDLKTLKEKIDKNYKEAPGLKKELYDILGIK